ncbi:stage II sporulation protein M [Accumulibacter sp.]|uniref:stage II sporulation protein M n=1 Tax=Accumulibacter sp. TaxID=2053492 RepID=UPI002CD65A32|nr:stage II sporulation protein M [Accumulibacter sp.]HNB66466.1 stage II sporulation protein M [Accumulibacter sp.]
MKERQYIACRQAEWQAWDDWLASRGKWKPTNSAPAETLAAADLPHRFRRLCHDLSLVRARNYSAAVADDLHRRVLAAHQRIYGSARPGGSVVLRFIAHGFPALVRREWRVVLAAALLLFVPLLGMLIAVQIWPDAAFLLLSAETVGEIEEMYSPGAAHLGRPRAAASEWAMWAFYIANNVRIDFQAFAGGIAFGLGTIFYMVFNGLYIGAVAGHLTQIGFVETFWGFVAGHSASELTGATLAGAAGLKLGMALVAPGRRSRLTALKENAQVAAELLCGAAALTFLAAFIEAFWSPQTGINLTVKLVVGTVGWLLTWAYLLLAGRRSDAP